MLTPQEVSVLLESDKDVLVDIETLRELCRGYELLRKAVWPNGEDDER
jgi:hypothetical protein